MATTDLTVGATVKIKVGRWSGRTATISEVLDEQPSVEAEGQQLDRDSTSLAIKNSLTVYSLEKLDDSEAEKLQKRCLTISYGNVRLAIEGDRRLLAAFTTQIQNDLSFVAEILAKALNHQQQQTLT